MKQLLTIKQKGISRLALILAVFTLSGCSSDVNYTPPEGSSDIAVSHYSFGKIVVDKKSYDHDILIHPDQGLKSWRTKINHVVQLSDLKSLMDAPVTTVILGIGASKMCKVENELMDYVKARGIKLFVEDTFESVKRFNATPKKGLLACFHVNC